MKTITVPDNELGKTVQLVINCSGTADQFKLEKGAALKFDLPNAAPEVGPSTIFQAIAQASSSSSTLLGSTPETTAQIVEWLTWANTQLTPLMDDKLMKVNGHLQTRCYLVGSSVTLADLVVFGTIHAAVTTFPAAQTLHFANLLRWADLLQHTADTQGVFSKFSLDRPKFKPPPPRAPPAPKASKDSAASASTAAAPAGKAAAAPAAAPAGKPAAAAPADKQQQAGKQQQPKQDAAAAPAAAEGGAKADKKADKAAKKADKAAKPAEPAKKAGEEASIDMLDIRVGQIVKVQQHPNAESLYLEEIDLGEDKPRQVISGLVKFVPVEKMQGRRVLVVCNLKPAKMREVMSYGMVLCASNDAHDQVDPVIVPEGAAIGERIKVEGFDGEPLAEVNPKKKILEKLFPDMKTDASGVCVYKGGKFMCSTGPVMATIPNAHVA